MARKDKLIKSNSIYTIRKKHSLTNGGTIYENDHVTIIPNDGIYDDEMALFSESIFKYRIRTGNETKKRHSRNAFVTDTNGSIIWTKDSISNETKSEESKVVLKPNYKSLKDFAYFGSAIELIRATIVDILLRFPGSICYRKEPFEYTINGETYYEVSNEMQINCWSNGNTTNEIIENPLRLLSVSYRDYVDSNGEALTEPPIINEIQKCTNTIIGTTEFANTILYIFLNKENNIKLLTKDKGNGIIIKPKQKIIDDFWSTLNDFEKVLLDKTTTPIYTAKFERPYFTTTGYYYDEQKFTWPITDDGYTPDLSSAEYYGYIENLINIATFYDENDSDNIWRMLTHESIKNLDWSFVRNENGEVENESDMDTSRIKAILRMYGRQFDDLKRYADNIKASNTITYDERNNIPDYFLTDIIENKGWEGDSISPTKDNNIISEAYSNISTQKEYTPSEANSNFMRRMILNSNYINSLKGTRKGIKAILGMFGFSEYDENNDDNLGSYSITEEIAIANTFPNYNKTIRLRAQGEYVNFGDNTDFMNGYPVLRVSPINGNESNDYLIPWYSNDEIYRNSLYFQEKGGWGHLIEKKISLSSAITTYDKIKEDSQTAIYKETEPYMKYASSIEAMLNFKNDVVEEGMICYVTDISDMYSLNGYNMSPDEDNLLKTDTGYSHYFILKTKALSHSLGYINNDVYSCYGWRNIHKIEFDGTLEEPTCDGNAVLYLETLISNYKGNNPHIGQRKYDDGNSYIERFNHLFSKAIEDGIYDFLKESTDEDDQKAYDEIVGVSFDVEPHINDNKKCYYFKDTTETNKLITIGNTDDDIDENNWDDGYENFIVPSAEPDYITKYDEASSFSVINTKNLTINFNISDNDYLKDYIETVVTKYVEQMVPSTTILRYTFNNDILVMGRGDEIDNSKLIRRFKAHMAVTDENVPTDGTFNDYEVDVLYKDNNE